MGSPFRGQCEVSRERDAGNVEGELRVLLVALSFGGSLGGGPPGSFGIRRKGEDSRVQYISQ